MGCKVNRTSPTRRYWRIKNYYRIEDSSGAVMSHPAPLQSGTINWRQAIRKAIEGGFERPFLVEHCGDDGLGVCPRNRDYI